jgi:DNA topoisomerase-1
MSTNLVIVESPAKAKTIKKYLTKDFSVIASYGHVRDLIPKSGAVDPTNNFAMHYTEITKHAKHVKALVSAIKTAQNLYLATDPDREGEAIAWHIFNIFTTKKLLKNKPVYRIVFHEITKEAITAAIATPRDIAMDLVNAQQARRALDYLVGFNLSPLLWRKVKRGLSAGRVQSPALRMIVERELAIENFVSHEYWDLSAQLQTNDTTIATPKFTAKLHSYLGQQQTQFAITTADEANSIKDHILQVSAGVLKVSKVSKKQRQRHPAPPFITATLQQEAARKLGFTAARTMRTAQQLYEGVATDDGLVGLITYMRTDSVNLAVSAIADIRKTIIDIFGQDYVTAKPRHYRTKAKNAQEAHEAIRPTAAWQTPDRLKAYLTSDQHKLYQLIWQRTIACQMISATFATVSIDLEALDNTTVIATFRATGSVIKHHGFLQVYPATNAPDNPAEPNTTSLLPPLTVDEQVTVQELNCNQHFTEPAPRYSEASLIEELEKCGIGRPSTYASIIATLQRRAYVQLVNKRFVPTDIGRIVNRFLTQYFPKYLEYNFTAHLEDELDAIARGEKAWIPLLQDFWQPFKQHVDNIATTVPRKEVTQEKLAENCPLCNLPLMIILGKNNRFIGCTGYPNCNYTRSLNTDTAVIANSTEQQDPTAECPSCGNALIIKQGRYGKFLGCSNYPECKHIASLNQNIDTKVSCPECQQATMLQRKSRRGKIFFSCQRYPDCKYATWQEPVAKACPQCAWPILTVKITKKRGTEHVCPRSTCNFSTSAPEQNN